jgi:hypothetical protein
MAELSPRWGRWLWMPASVNPKSPDCAASCRSETVESHSCETLTSHPYETQRHSGDGLSDRVADLAARLPEASPAIAELRARGADVIHNLVCIEDNQAQAFW